MTKGRDHYEAPCFRHSGARHATIDEGTLLASVRAGGRFNPPGEFGAVYVALERKTAMAELERRIAVSGLPRAHFHPRVLLRLRARLLEFSISPIPSYGVRSASTSPK